MFQSGSLFHEHLDLKWLTFILAFTIRDNFLFQHVMRNERLCKHLIEKFLNIQIRSLQYQSFEKTIDLRLEGKSIRLDVFVEDNEGRVYDIEMQCSNSPRNDLAKRSRFYQSLIDGELLDKGKPYEELNPSYVIFICTFDPFHRGLPIYTFTHCCKEDNRVQLKDEETRMFLNSKGSENAADPDIAAFLRYVDGKAAEGRFVESLDQEVHLVKSMDKVRREYMILSDEIRRRQKEAAEEGWQEGMQKGMQKGMEKGMQQGMEKGRRQMLLNFLSSGMSVEQVAAGAKVPIDYVRKLAEEMKEEV